MKNSSNEKSFSCKAEISLFSFKKVMKKDFSLVKTEKKEKKRKKDLKLIVFFTHFFLINIKTEKNSFLFCEKERE